MPTPSASAAPTFPPSRLSQAVLLACLSLGLGATATVAQAQASAQAPVRHEIPAGPLDDVLTRFAATAGVPLTIDGQLTAGKRSAGLSGSYGVPEGLAAILSGSGLSAAAQPGGGFAVVKDVAPAAAPAGQGGEAALPAVKVRSTATLDATTEGTGSYTTGAASTSTGLNLSLRETPQSVTVVTRQRMEDQGLTQLMDVMAQTAGLTIDQGGNAGSDSSTIYSRGFAVENYLVDGVGQNYSNYSSIFQTTDMVLYDRVEVLRGAAGLMSGTGSPGATVNLIRKKPTREFQASGRVEAGSWNLGRVELDVSGALNTEGTVRGRVVGAYQENDSYIDRLHEDTQVLYGVIEADLTPDTKVNAGVVFQKHDATAHARGGRPFYDSNGNFVRWARSDSAAADWAYSNRRNETLFGSVEHKVNSDWTVKATASQARSDYDEVLGYASGGNPDPTTGTGVKLWAGRWEGQPRQTSIDVNARGNFDAWGQRHELLVGASSARTHDKTPTYNLWFFDDWTGNIPNIYTWDGSTPAAPNNPANGEMEFTEKISALYSAARLKATDSLSVIAGARVTDWRSDSSSSGSREENGELTPFAAVVFDFTKDLSVYASYTNIFKPVDKRDAAGNYLAPEVGNAYELGIKGAFFENQLNLSAAVYEIQQDNLGVAVEQDPDLPPPPWTEYRTVAGAKTRGFELEASGALTRNWQVYAGFARNLSKDFEGNALNTSVPTNTFKAFTSYRIPNIGNGLTVGGGWRWQNKIYSGDFTQGAYGIVDLMARYQVNRNIGVSLNVNNVFDKSYYTSTWNSYYGAPLNARAALDVKF